MQHEKEVGTRCNAIDYLKATLIQWPAHLEAHFGPKEFYGWRFVEALDGVIYFANCVEPGITKHEIVGLNGWPSKCGATMH